MNEKLQWALLAWLFLSTGVALVMMSYKHPEHEIQLGLLGIAHVLVGCLIMIGPFVLAAVQL